MKNKPIKSKLWVWIAGWLSIVLLGSDFYNWGKLPRLILGMPDWVWFDLGLILLTALMFALLSQRLWEDE